LIKSLKKIIRDSVTRGVTIVGEVDVHYIEGDGLGAEVVLCGKGHWKIDAT
jgi:hypothetical protein